MALPTIPSITVIKNRIISDVAGKINQFIPILPLAFTKVVASAIAGIIYLLYQAIVWVYKQIFPESADDVSLALLGAIVGIFRVAEVQAVLLCTVPGTGPQVNAGTLFFGSNAVTYRVETTTAIVAGEALNVPMLALTGGDIGNLANGEILDITSTGSGLTGTAEVTSTQTDGADQESLESFAARVSIRYRIRDINGSVGAYTLNGLETPNFTWIGPFADEDLPGTVNVYGRVDNQTDGIPTSSQLTTLLSFLKNDTATGKEYRRPISDTINTLPISVREFDVEIFINASSPELDAAVEEAVKTFITTLEPFIIGVSDVRKDVLTNANVVGVANSAAEQEGAAVTQVIITDVVTTSIETSYSFLGGEFGKFRNVSFTVVV